MDSLVAAGLFAGSAVREPSAIPPQNWESRMSLALETVRSPAPNLPVAAVSPPAAQPDYQVIRRNGVVTAFDASKIAVALTKAFLAVEGNSAAASRRVHDVVAELTRQIVSNLTRRADAGRAFHIEDVQDQVELALMRGRRSRRRERCM
jgi:ribonucleoside-diphosphate reductase alpha chain